MAMHDDRLDKHTAYVAGRVKEIIGPEGSVTTDTNQYCVTFHVTPSPEDAKRMKMQGSLTSIMLRQTMLDESKLDWVVQFVTQAQ